MDHLPAGSRSSQLIWVFHYDHHPSVSIIRIVCHDYRPSASIIRIWRQIHRRRKMSRVFWRRQWALWAEGSVATLVSMCFMSQTNQIPPSDDTWKVHNAPGSTPPADDHQPSVTIISVVCYDHQPSVTIIWFVCHNHRPSYGF